jgi:hypothetical protein
MDSVLDRSVNFVFSQTCTKGLYIEAVQRVTAGKIETYTNPLYLWSPTFILGHGQLGEAYSDHRFDR